jgi:predicted phage terminase large subunit-like protein
MSNLIIDVGNNKKKEITFYIFAKYILGYSKLTDVHKLWCVDSENISKRKLILRPRGTYKSTLHTVSYILWRIIQNPNIRILIANSTSDNAEAFLREITSQLIRNTKFTDVFGKLLDANASKVSSITVNTRTKHAKEPTVSCIGVLGNLVSNHYDLVLCDDLCNAADRESESIREKKKAWYRDLLSILEPDGEIVVVGTPWAYSDLYAYIEHELNPKLLPAEQYLIIKEGCYLEDGITPKFPAILPIEILERLKIEKGPLEFSSQYMVKVMPQEAQIFFENDFKTFDYLGTNRVKDGDKVYEVEFVGYCDLSIGKSKSSDFTALVTLGKGKEGTVYIVDIVLERMPPDRTMEVIFAKHKIFDYKKYGVESNVFQSLFSEQMKKYSAEHQCYLPVIEVGHSSNKNLRIQSLQPLIKQGLLKIRSDWKDDRDYKELINQFVYFPLGGHDDGPDSVEGAFSLLKKRGNWRGTPYFAAGSYNADVSGFDSKLDMSKFDITISTQSEQQQFFGNYMNPQQGM